MRDFHTWVKSVEDRLENHDRRLRSSGPRIPDIGWTTIPLAGGWQVMPAGIRAPQYRRVNGYVELRGWAQYVGGGSSAGPGTMPSGCRPSGLEDFTVYANSGWVGRCRVNTDGTLALSAVLASPAAVSFGHIKYEADGS